MPLDDWIAKYPQVQALLQQPDEVLEYEVDAASVSQLLPTDQWGWWDHPDDDYPYCKVCDEPLSDDADSRFCQECALWVREQECLGLDWRTA